MESLKRSVEHAIHTNDGFAVTKIRSTFGGPVETFDKESNLVISQLKDGEYCLVDTLH